MIQDKPTRRRSGEWPGWLLAILGFLFVVALLTGVWIARQRAEHQRNLAELQKRLEAIRAAGQPMTAQDLARLYPDPPPEKDASLLLKPALDILAIPDESTNLLFFGLNLPRSTSLDQSVVAEGQQWLDRNQAAFDLIPWSKLQGAWVGSGFTNGLTNITHGPLTKMGNLGRFLLLSAVLQAERQHPQEAMQSLHRAAIVANTLRNDLPIHFMFKSGMEGKISLALERVINRVNLSGADLASFPSFLTLTNIGAVKETVMINQRPSAFLWADFLETTSQLRGLRLLRAIGRAPLYRDEDLLHYLDWSDHCLAALDSPMSNAIPVLRNMEDQQEKLVKNRHVLLDVFKKERFSLISVSELQITCFLLPELKAVAHVRLAVAALAVERWRLANGGQVPASLAELVPNFLPAIPADPFDGQPLRYKKLVKGYVLYSIGENLTDDGGKEQPADAAEADHYDITFTVDK